MQFLVNPPKKRIFVRRHHAKPALLSCRVVTVVSSLPNPSLTLSSFLPSSYDQHFTAAQREELPLASLPWWWRWRRRGGGDGGGGGTDICSWKISIVTLKEKSQTPSRIYTHTFRGDGT